MESQRAPTKVDGNCKVVEENIKKTDSNLMAVSQEIHEKSKLNSLEAKVETDEQGCEKSEVNGVTHASSKETVLRKTQNQVSTKKRKKGNKNSNPNKKRKRIQEICDSDSSGKYFVLMHVIYYIVF